MEMSKAVELTTATFKDQVAQGVTLVDFWAEWCGPCRMMGPILDELAGQYEGKLTIGKINVDNEPDLAQMFNVSSIPTLIVIKNGDEAQRFVGVTPKTVLAAALDKACG
jgi:thioredoxin 1